MQLTEKLEELILNGEYESVKTLLEGVEDEVLNTDGMNLLAKVFDVGLRTAFTKEQIIASTDIIIYITSKMSPKEAIITLLEQIEMVDLDYKLYCTLGPLQVALIKLPGEKWETHLEWILQVLSKRFVQMKLPSVFDNPESRWDHKELEALEAVAGKLHSEIYVPIQGFVNFYSYCLDYILNTPHMESPGKLADWKNILRPHVMLLLGRPLGLCPFQYPQDAPKCPSAGNTTEKAPVSTVAAQVAMEVVKLLERLNTSAFVYHSLLHRKIDENAEVLSSTSEDAENSNNDSQELDLISVASYFDMVYGKNMYHSGPGSPVGDIYTGFYLVYNLLENENIELKLKALRIAQLLLDQLCPQSPFHRLRSEFLQTNVHLEFVSKLSHVITFSDHYDIRRQGAFVFKAYIWAFDAAGRYQFINCILNSSGYSDSLIGFVITQLKEFISLDLEKLSGSPTSSKRCPTDSSLPEMEKYFTGKHLRSLLKLSLKLDHGPSFDMVSVEGQVLSALNLIRFLLIRDGKNNLSGIRSYLTEINEDFLKIVRVSLDVAVLKAKTRLKELEDPAHMEWETRQAEEVKCEMLVQGIEGVQLSGPQEMSLQDQIQSCKNVLTKMDLLQCVLVHTTECYDSVTSATPN